MSIRKGSVRTGESPGAGMHPLELEYMKFRPVKIREELRRVWLGNRYGWRMCAVYDAGRCLAPTEFHSDKWAEVNLPLERSRRRNKTEMKELADLVASYLHEHGPSMVQEVAQELDESAQVVRNTLRKNRFRCVGEGEPPKNGGQRPHIFDLAPEWKEWYG